MSDARLEALEAEVVRAEAAVDDQTVRDLVRAVGGRNRYLVVREVRRLQVVVVALVVVLAVLGASSLLLSKGQTDLAEHNCRNIGGLAAIERAFITRQESQSRALLESGVTFGIPPSKLPGLLAASRASQALFLRELDRLTSQNCSVRTLKSAPVVRPSTTGTRGTPPNLPPGSAKPSRPPTPPARSRSGARLNRAPRGPTASSPRGVGLRTFTRPAPVPNVVPVLPTTPAPVAPTTTAPPPVASPSAPPPIPPTPVIPPLPPLPRPPCVPTAATSC